MSDNDVIKALVCCANGDMCRSACPYDKNFKTVHKCTSQLSKDALALINRQQAEIERLKSMNQAKLDMIHDLRTDLEKAKSEARKEFAQRLNEKSKVFEYRDGYLRLISVNDIDSLLAEMCGKENNETEKETAKGLL